MRARWFRPEARGSSLSPLPESCWGLESRWHAGCIWFIRGVQHPRGRARCRPRATVEGGVHVSPAVAKKKQKGLKRWGREPTWTTAHLDSLRPFYIEVWCGSYRPGFYSKWQIYEQEVRTDPGKKTPDMENFREAIDHSFEEFKRISLWFSAFTNGVSNWELFMTGAVKWVRSARKTMAKSKRKQTQTAAELEKSVIGAFTAKKDEGPMELYYRCAEVLFEVCMLRPNRPETKPSYPIFRDMETGAARGSTIWEHVPEFLRLLWPGAEGYTSREVFFRWWGANPFFNT